MEDKLAKKRKEWEIWAEGASTDDIVALGLELDGAVARLKELGCEFCPTRYEYCHHPHMLGQCITWEDAKRISADGP